MLERMEFCPKCNGIRKMSLTLGMMPVGSEDGPEVTLLYHYHCTSCNAYVGSKTMEGAEILLPEEIAASALPAYA
jgi:hypothetical protein